MMPTFKNWANKTKPPKTWKSEIYTNDVTASLFVNTLDFSSYAKFFYTKTERFYAENYLKIHLCCF